MVATLALFAGFTGWMTWVRLRGLRLRCGCFGTGGAEIGRSTIVRNALLIAVCLAGLRLTLQVHSPLPVASFDMMIVISSLGMCLVLVQTLRTGRVGLVLSMAELSRRQEQAANLQPKVDG